MSGSADSAGQIPRAGGQGVCGCLLESPLEDFRGWLRYDGVGLVEWRIDRFAQNLGENGLDPFFRALSDTTRHPVIATNRPVREMGAFSGPEDLRLQILRQAAEAGAEWIDLEHDAAATTENVKGFKASGSKVLVSWHCVADTPSKAVLTARLETMCKTGADALKIVTLAQSDEDNLRVLELIPLAGREFGIDLVAFCMGAAGKWSRLVSLFLGSPWTYAQLPGQSTAAPGQISVSEMWDLLRTMDRL